MKQKNCVLSDGYENLGGDGELDDLSKPLTRAELQNRVMEGVKKKETEAAKDGYQFDLAPQKNKTKKN
ncbi:unnamed protein product [Brachionus calyciflorus]|uniref:Uncharacterized protein n=1 Tax=Brachionus calyciflorus TaxID=104777 RepID=A0A813Y0G3_9BILA|nr:unnamed protein product [Brachionus calyciflorus]